MKPYLIAIAGMSCSGKSTIAEAIAAKVPSAIFRLDEYYLKLDHLAPEERVRFDFDRPDAFDETLIVQHIYQLAAGNPIQQPVYDFARYTRTGKTTVLEPNDYVIVEGIFALYWERMRALYGTKVFVEASHNVCLPRRQSRDVAERGRTPESVITQYEKTVRPGADEFVVPCKQYADVVVDGSQPVVRSVKAILSHIHRRPE